MPRPGSVREYATLAFGVPGGLPGGATALGGAALLAVPVHALDGPEHSGPLEMERLSTTEMDTTLVARPDGAGGVEFAAESIAFGTPYTEQFTAAGGSPETFTLFFTPLGTTKVYRDGLRLAAADVAVIGTSLEVTTTVGQIVTVDYEH